VPCFKLKIPIIQSKAGGVDRIKRYRYNRTIIARIGIEIQVSARSDLLIRDIVHIRNKIQNGEIEVGIVIVPNENMQKFLPDQTPSIKDAIRYAEEEFKEAVQFPIVLLAIEHDGSATKALPKQKKKLVFQIQSILSGLSNEES